MSAAIKNELIKLGIRKKILAVFVFSLVIIMLSMVMDYFDPDVEEFSSNELAEMEEMQLNSLIENDKVTEQYIGHHIINMAIIAENNIPINGYQTAPYLLQSEITSGFFISIILPLAIIILCSDIIVGEVNSGSLKSLLFSPLGRKKIIYSKFLATTLTILCLSIVYFFLEYIRVGMLHGFSGWTDKIILSTPTPQIYSVWQGVLLGLVLLTFTIAFYVSLAIFFSVIFNSITSSILGFIACILIQITTPLYVEKIPYIFYSVFSNVKLFKFLDRTSMTQQYGVDFLIAISLITFTTFILLYSSYITFKKKDLFV